MLSAAWLSRRSTTGKVIDLMAFEMIRRGQLIAPFGVGAAHVLSDGTGIVVAGLDHWFERDSGDALQGIDFSEFELHEWRLERELRVSGFRLPPDSRIGGKIGDEQQNMRLTVPVLRFPTWHLCRRCRRMNQEPLSRAQSSRCERCGAEKGNKGPERFQVRFVAVCEGGHLMDFPFREWVHHEQNPTCTGELRLRGSGGAGLVDQLVLCACGAKRTLQGITAEHSTGGVSTTYLSRFLTSRHGEERWDDHDDYLCPGISVWHGSLEPKGCDRPIRATLRGASNAYFSIVKSSIFLPQAEAIDGALLRILSEGFVAGQITFMRDLGVQPKAEGLLKDFRMARLLEGYDPALIDHALSVVSDAVVVASESDADDWDEDAFRVPEYEALRTSQSSEDLRVTDPTGPYFGITASHLEPVKLVERLRETRVLVGFTRLNPDSGLRVATTKKILRTDKDTNTWLPGYVVHGEGLLFSLSLERLEKWEAGRAIQRRTQLLQDHYRQAQMQRALPDRQLSPRFVLLHTFSHLLMNRLTFECGYSSASLRERLYCGTGMASVLVYTAAGDSEGTMGGLVRMGKPGRLEPIIEAAIEEARWCSSDPICMECGEVGGQGPDSCNLAACHSCCLVPETACEGFNRFLDRAMLIGSLKEPNIGFFSVS